MDIRIICLFLITAFLPGCCKSNKTTEELLEQVAASGREVRFGEVATFTWDTVYVVGPYQSFDHSHIKKLPCRVKDRIEIQKMLENKSLLIFTYNERFVSYSEIRASIFTPLGLDGGTHTPETELPLSP